MGWDLDPSCSLQALDPQPAGPLKAAFAPVGSSSLCHPELCVPGFSLGTFLMAQHAPGSSGHLLVSPQWSLSTPLAQHSTFMLFSRVSKCFSACPVA